jgi:hypothetical protein
MRRRTVGLLVAALAAATLSIGTPSVAQAQDVTCSNIDTVDLSDGSAAATVTAKRNCWDNASWYEIVVRDIACDDRAAHLELKFYNPDTFINERLNRYAYRTEVVSASGGCNTETTAVFSSTNPDPDLYACAFGKNAQPFSNWVSDCATF